MCKDNEKAKAMTLFASSLRPVKSCLTPFVNGKVCPSMIRAILEVIVNGAANSVSQVADYLDCTLFSAGMVIVALFKLTVQVFPNVFPCMRNCSCCQHRTLIVGIFFVPVTGTYDCHLSERK